LAHRVAPDLAARGCSFAAVMTDHGSEFAGQFKIAVEELGVEHRPHRRGTAPDQRLRRTRPGHQPRGMLETRVRPASPAQHHRPTRRTRRYLRYYNTHRAHTGRWTRGRTPEQVIGKAKMWARYEQKSVATTRRQEKLDVQPKDFERDGDQRHCDRKSEQHFNRGHSARVEEFTPYFASRLPCSRQRLRLSSRGTTKEDQRRENGEGVLQVTKTTESGRNFATFSRDDRASTKSVWVRWSGRFAQHQARDFSPWVCRASQVGRPRPRSKSSAS
jgi:hypothetical protein